MQESLYYMINAIKLSSDIQGIKLRTTINQNKFNEFYTQENQDAKILNVSNFLQLLKLNIVDVIHDLLELKIFW